MSDIVVGIAYQGLGDITPLFSIAALDIPACSYAMSARKHVPDDVNMGIFVGTAANGVAQFVAAESLAPILGLSPEMDEKAGEDIGNNDDVQFIFDTAAGSTLGINEWNASRLNLAAAQSLDSHYMHVNRYGVSFHGNMWRERTRTAVYVIGPNIPWAIIERALERNHA